MTKDLKVVSSKNIKKSTNKKDEKKYSKKQDESSDSDSCEYYTESDYSENDSEEEEMDDHEYRKLLSKMFPSKFMDKKVKAGNELKNAINKKNKKAEVDKDEDSDNQPNDEVLIKKKYENQKKNKQNEKKNKQKEIEKSKKRIIESESESEEEDDDDDDDEEEVFINKKGKNKNNKLNIIFTVGDGLEDDDEDYDEDYEDWSDYDSQYETENEDDSIHTEDLESEDDFNDEEVTKKGKKEKWNKEKKEKGKEKGKEKEKSIIETKKQQENNKVKENVVEVVDEKKSDESVLEELKQLLQTNKNNKSIEKYIKVLEEDMNQKKEKSEKKQKKEKERNGRIFKQIIRDKNTTNDFSFFETLEIENQKKIIKELREINKIIRVEKPYRLALLESNIPPIFKAAAMKKIASLRYMEPGSGEYYKIKNWVDTFMRIPFGKYENLPVNINDGVDKCHEFMETAQKTLDNAVYGLNDAKMQIMQLLGQLITNPQATGTAIAVHGPMGSGKTSLIKEGVSKILNRPFAFIALGGATDSSFLEGHSYTYEGSVWGKIVQILIDSKCMNPVIYFDELDKISDTPKGEEIASILTHLTDTSQNSQFHDKYFAEMDFDLSKCLFIFSYNDETKVNPILRDRMYRIQTKGYDKKQKTIIANKYLLPKIMEQVKFNNDDIIIPDEILHYIIETHCNKEDGVRNMKRALEIIYTKLNLYRLMKPGTNLFEQEMALKVVFPFTVSKDIIDKLIKKEKNDNASFLGIYT